MGSPRTSCDAAARRPRPRGRRLRVRLLVAAMLLGWPVRLPGGACGAQTGLASASSSGSASTSIAWRVVVVIAGESDPAVATQVAALGANALATITPPRLETALAAESAGLAYLPRFSTREIDRLSGDAGRVESIRGMPAIAGFQYIDEDVEEGYASPETQARAYGILKALFPGRLVLYATRLDLVATDAGFLPGFYRPEFTDLVVPYFYPVGTTVLGVQEESDPWESRLRSLLEPLAAATPEGKPIRFDRNEAGAAFFDDFQRRLREDGLPRTKVLSGD